MDQSEVLKVENLQKYFPVRQGLIDSILAKGKDYIKAVDNVSFSLGQGEILGFVGESGCGKSTMSRTILRLTEPTAGTVYYQGHDISSLSKKKFKPYRQKMQMIFQDPFGSLNPRRTVSDTLRQTIRIHRLAETREQESEMIHRVLEEVELKPADRFKDKYPVALSGGQLQRVCIGRVLVLQPNFIIADEAVSMLDVSVRIGVLDLIRRMRDKFGISFIYITHDLVTARYICDRIVIMYLGQIVEIGPIEEIVHNPRHPYTQALIAAVPSADPTVEPAELPIKGYVPHTVQGDQSSCLFYQRCPYGSKECQNCRPQMAPVDEHHLVRCLRTNCFQIQKSALDV